MPEPGKDIGSGRQLHGTTLQQKLNRRVTSTREVLDSRGGDPGLAMTTAVDALRDCEQASNACAMAMAMISDGGMVAEVRRALDCADMCQATHRVLSRGPAPDETVVATLVDACITASPGPCDPAGTPEAHFHPNRGRRAKPIVAQGQRRAPGVGYASRPEVSPLTTTVRCAG